MFNFIKQPILQVPVRYGLIAGAFGFALMILLYYMDRHPFLILPFFDFRILLFPILIIFSLKEIRDYYQEGILFFWQAMMASFTFTLTFAFLCALLTYLYTLIDTEFTSSYIELALQQAKEITQENIDTLGKERYDILLSDIPKTSGYLLARRFFFQSFILSFFFSLIISVILRRQPKSQ